jgi:hypothetical protein
VAKSCSFEVLSLYWYKCTGFTASRRMLTYEADVC